MPYQPDQYPDAFSYTRGYADAVLDMNKGGGSKTGIKTTKPKRKKLSKWQQFVKKNSKFPRFKYKSGKKKGMINLKALGVAYRKKKR